MSGTFEGVGSLQFTPDNKFAYAYSGAFAATTAAQTMLEIDSGHAYLVGKIITSGSIGFGSVGGLKSAFQISLNDTVIAYTLVDNQTDHSSSITKVNVVLPPYTRLKIEVDSDDNNVSVFSTAIFVAKVKGAIQQENLEAISNNNKWASL